MTGFLVDLDFSFIKDILKYFKNPTNNDFERIIGHEAAIGIYSHAKRFQKSDLDLSGFFHKLIKETREKGTDHIREINQCL